MSIRLFVLILYTGLYLEVTAFQLLRIYSLRRPAPENVSDMYGRRSYARWQRCQQDLSLFNICRFSFDYTLIMVLILTGVLFTFSSLSVIIRALCSGFIAFYLYIIPSCQIAIKQKYGLGNKDPQRYMQKGLLSFAITFIVYVVCDTCFVPVKIEHKTVANISLTEFLFIFLAFLSVRYYFRAIKQYRRCMKIEGRELSLKLRNLAQSGGVSTIEFQGTPYCNGIMEAAIYRLFRRNVVVFSKSLLTSMEEDSICAVAAHEIGHAVHKHMVYKDILSIFLTSGIIIAIWSFYSLLFSHSSMPNQLKTIYEVSLLVGILIGIPVCIIAKNRIYQLQELQADAYAVQAGLGNELITALKLSEKNRIREMNPHPLLQLLNTDHPPITQRIEQIEREKQRVCTFF